MKGNPVFHLEVGICYDTTLFSCSMENDLISLRIEKCCIIPGKTLMRSISEDSKSFLSVLHAKTVMGSKYPS